MWMLSKETLDSIRKEYPVGARVELLQMEDDHAPAIGTKGTVKGVDDIGSIMVAWDNGSCLHVLYGVDSCRIIPACETICYGERQRWTLRQDAINFFLEGMVATEGSERERYTNIYTKLVEGLYTCSDD